jgi:S-formylglutathione hydrolase FrmB
MSGVLDISNITHGYDVDKRLGDPIVNKQYYTDLSVINVIEKSPTDSLAIIIDCGTEDDSIATNRKVHEKMLRLKILHDYTERPGKDNWEYWRNAIKYQMLFFDQYFQNHLVK